MCGIIGYIGPRDVSSVLLGGLKRLEYRGYDSAGMTIKNSAGLATFKAVGRITELEKKISGKKLEGNLGIAIPAGPLMANQTKLTPIPILTPKAR